MKKILIFSLFMSMSFSLNAFNLYNATSLDDLQDGARLNKIVGFGLCDTEQATLIGPRLAVTARHHGQGDVAVDSFISFYGQRCKVIHTVDRPDLKIGQGDLTLYVLDRDIILPEGEAFCPIATQSRHMGRGYGDGNGFIAHAISHSPRLKLAGQKTPSNNKRILYGRTHVDYAPFIPSDHDTAYKDSIHVVMNNGKDCDLMTPIKGDSGSPLFVPLKNGGYALWGVLSCVDATDAHAFGRYTSLACNISWLQRKEQDLINRGILPASAMRIKTVDQKDWDLTRKDSLALPRNFDTELYLALNPDLAKAFQHTRSPADEAKDHFLRHGRREQRTYNLPESFKTKRYLAFNSDLEAVASTFSPDRKERFLELHYALHGQKENRLYTLPDAFCWASYLALNKDLIPFVDQLTSEETKDFAKFHFARYGHKEKRLYTLETPFNWSAYLGANPDLDPYVSELSFKDKKLFVQKHFALHGYHEGDRNYTLSPEFNAKNYLSFNKDLTSFIQKMSQTEQDHFLTFHYIRCGQKEGRLYRFPKSFDLRCYYGFNPDLRHRTKHLASADLGAFLLSHFIEFGYKEGRQYALPDDFDAACYLALHHDLRRRSRAESDPLTFARNHYRRRGILEGRAYKIPLPHDFTVAGYLTKNPDIAAFLASYSEAERQRFATKHYQTRGFLLEGRSY